MLCGQETLWRGSLEECIVTVLWPFLGEMSLYDILLLRRAEPNGPGPFPCKICFEALFWSFAIARHPSGTHEQLHVQTKGEGKLHLPENLPRNFLLPRKLSSPLSVGFIWLAAV